MAARPGIRPQGSPAWGRWLVALFLPLVLALPATAQEAERQLVAGLVADLGYGGAIHHFSDYLLRGDDALRQAATRDFAAAKLKLDTLRRSPGLDPEQREAVELLDRTIGAYLAALATIERLYRNRTSLAKVLATAKARGRIDDAGAIAALETLRRGFRWRRIERLRFVLGYGGAIHHYKNYLIHRDEVHRQQAEARLREALQLAAELRWTERNRPGRLAAVHDIEAVLEEYLASLPVVERTLAPAREARSEIAVSIAVRGADRALKVDDGPAIEALARLER